ncbi:MAG: YcaO-like family protein [Proteobacteria bacterium]|nr:YcaO-like family protein [Pseudomonadota bacterium]MBU1650100.1 YcaO-like family protein [Pseudomonadota bacterium]MBU1985729.1 YcaO-like family protein [Pseudomonadota bacterium]
MKKKSIRLQDCLKTYTTDQDKAVRPEDTVARFKERLKHLDVEILKEVKRIDNGRLDIPVFFSVCGEDAHALTGTKKQMGKGASPIQAEASACMELAERFSFFAFKNDENNFITGDYQQMRDAGYPVLDPSRLLQSVHDTRHDVNFLEELLQNIPMQWTWATSLTSGLDILIPFSWFFAINEFNGPSAGNTYEEAALQGISEVVERHVCALVNHEKIPTPVIDPASVQDPVARDLLEKFARNNIELYLNDFSLDTGISTVAALAIDRSTFPDTSEIVFTAGTTPDPEKALIRAVTEVAQLAGDFNSGSNYVASGLPKPLSMEDVRYVTAPGLSTTIEQMPSLADHNIKTEVENCVAALAKRDMEVFMLDATHPALQIPAIYTIIPGAHFRERSMIQDVGLFAAKLLVELVEDTNHLEQKLVQMEQLIPDAYYLAFYRGRNLYNHDQPESALHAFDRALALFPEQEDLPYIYSYMGHCLKDLGRYDEAIKALNKGREEDDERPDLHNVLGVCYYKKEDFNQAIVHFHRAVELNPVSAMDYANLGVNYRKIGKRDEAVHFFTLALSLDSSIDFAKAQLAELIVQG